MTMADLLSSKIEWREDPDRHSYYRAEVQGIQVEMQLRNFPDDIVCTVFLFGEAHDLDDFGDKWSFATPFSES